MLYIVTTMSQIEKLLHKFFQSPQSIKYADIEKILIYLDFVQVPAKGSHVKWKHKDLDFDIVIPVHNHECKGFYKQQVSKQIANLIKT